MGLSVPPVTEILYEVSEKLGLEFEPIFEEREAAKYIAEQLKERQRSMIKDITLGQYYPVESPIHRLEARTKVLGVFAYLVGLFLVNKLWGICNCGGCSWNSN